MKGKIRSAVALILVATAIALGVCVKQFVLVEKQLYPRDTSFLDLRGQEISAEHYEKLSTRLPDARIRWDIPFQGGTLADDTQELTLTSLTCEEAELLARCLPELHRVDAWECTDYDALVALKQLLPDLLVRYRVCIGGMDYASSATQLKVDSITREELDLLRYLPRLDTVTLTGGDPALLAQLQEYCTGRDIGISLIIQGQQISPDTRELHVDHITDGEVELMYLLPQLKSVHLTEPNARAEKLIRLQEDRPDVTVTWEKTLLGHTYDQDTTLVDLTDVISLGDGQLPGALTVYAKGLAMGIQGTPEEERTSIKIQKHEDLPSKIGATADLIKEIEAAMAYFPKAETLLMLGSVLDNDAMADFRQRHAEEYKVVWTVQCGKIATRTDATFFMPVKYHVYYLNSAEAANLRYCPEMIAVDIGHMSVSDVSFVEYMPNLRYLILAHTAVRDIEPLRSCKNLVFLELDHTGVLDFSPLLDCPALEDLNIGKTWNDVAPLKKMTWLKNLWMVFRPNSAPEMVEALPNTRVVYGGSATVDSGWRDLPNYFAMRDELKMFYMTW